MSKQSIGKSIARVDARGKVTGEAQYSGDLHKEGMLQNQRTRSAGSFLNRFRKVELYKELRHIFTELEQSVRSAHAP